MVLKIRTKARKSLPLLFIVALLIGGFFYLKSRTNAIRVTVTKAEVRSISKTITASGRTGVLEGNTSRGLVAGTIKNIRYKSGDQVKKDDVVIEMDQASLKASLDTAYASYLTAKTDLDTYDQKIKAAQATEDIRKRERDEAWQDYMGDNGETKKQLYKNAEALYQTAFSSRLSLEDGKKATASTFSSKYSSYYSALSNYQSSTIKAPTGGNLALNNIYQGSYVTAGQELFSITSSSDLIFKAEIDEADISNVKKGMKVKLNLDSYPGIIFNGLVENIDSKVETLANGSVIIRSDISFDGASIIPILGLGGSADIEFDKSESTISISPDAIIENLGEKYVYVVLADTVYKRKVEVSFEGDEYVGLKSGINEGDLVVLEASGLQLKNGQKVKI